MLMLSAQVSFDLPRPGPEIISINIIFTSFNNSITCRRGGVCGDTAPSGEAEEGDPALLRPGSDTSELRCSGGPGRGEEVAERGGESYRVQRGPDNSSPSGTGCGVDLVLCPR